MYRLTKNIFTIILCFISFGVWAQDSTIITPPVFDSVTETVITEVGADEDELYDDTMLDTTTGEEVSTKKNSFDSLLANNEVVQVRNIPDSLVKRFLTDEDYWYASVAPQKKKIKKPSTQKESFINTTWFSNLFWIVVISTFIGLLIWYIATGNAGIWQKKSASIANEKEEEEEDIFALDFASRIKQETDKGNYRMATRLWYLQTLKNLSDQNIINYTRGSTNSQYLVQMQQSHFYTMFFQLTRGFEYTWYGNFHLSNTAYQQLEKDFVDLNRQLQS